MKMKDRKLKNGRIVLRPCQDGLLWSIDLELPRCDFTTIKKNQRWLFFHQGLIDTTYIDHNSKVSEIEVYREAVIGLINQLNNWLRVIDKAVEYERDKVSK